MIAITCMLHHPASGGNPVNMNGQWMLRFRQQPETPVITPADLRCEHLTNPLGMDTPAPRFTWLLEDLRNETTQAPIGDKNVMFFCIFAKIQNHSYR